MGGTQLAAWPASQPACFATPRCTLTVDLALLAAWRSWRLPCAWTSFKQACERSGTRAGKAVQFVIVYSTVLLACSLEPPLLLPLRSRAANIDARLQRMGPGCESLGKVGLLVAHWLFTAGSCLGRVLFRSGSARHRLHITATDSSCTAADGVGLPASLLPGRNRGGGRCVHGE